MGDARERDSHGRALPVWQGCRVVAEGEVFLMNRQSADSFDGRYFGPLPATTIVGRADPLWTDGRNDRAASSAKFADHPSFAPANTLPPFRPSSAFADVGASPEAHAPPQRISSGRASVLRSLA